MHALITAVAAFAFGFIGSMPLTGPIAVLLVARVSQKQARTALGIAFGASLAEGVYAAVSYWGFATFLARHPKVLPATHAISALVLTGVGLYFLRWKPDAGDARHEQRKASGFWLGFVVSALNPTLLATWSAAVAVLYSRQLVSFRPWLALPFGGAAALGIACWELIFVWMLTRFEHRFPKGAMTILVRVIGMLVIGAGVYSGYDFWKALASTAR